MLYIRKDLGNILIIIMMSLMLIGFSAIDSKAASNEREPNDSMLQANTITVGDTVYGNTAVKDMGIYNQNDDWFKFTPPVSGTFKVVFNADNYTTKESSEVSCTAYDSNNNRLTHAWDAVRISSDTTITFPVSYGKTYYLLLYGTDGTGAFTDVSYHFTTGYDIGRTTITAVKGQKKGFKVTWNKKAKASFYQVQYVKKSVYSDYGWSNAKTVNVPNKSKSKAIKKLSKKKPYYVRVRVARTIQGKTYYSDWSPRKSIKTK